MQQLAVGGVLMLLVLALLYFDSGHGHSTGDHKKIRPRDPEDPEHPTLTRQEEIVPERVETATCRALSQMQVCSHRGALGSTDPHSTTPLLERLARLAAASITCIDIDVVRTSDGQLVVGYPAHIAAELKAAGRAVPPLQAGSDGAVTGGLEAVPWSEYTAAGLAPQHPLLGEALEAFARIVTGKAEAAAGSDSAATAGSAGSAAEQEATGKAQTQAAAQGAQPQAQAVQQQGAAATPASTKANRSDAASSTPGRRLRRQLLQDPQQQQQQQQAAASGSGPPPGVLLLVELKGGAMGVAAAQALLNASRALGIERRLGLWFPRRPTGAAATAEVKAYLTASGGGSVLRVLGLPDISHAANGSATSLPLALEADDAAAYDMFGPSVRHTDAALAQVVAAAAGATTPAGEAVTAPRRTVTWIVDSPGDALRAARAGIGMIVSDDPLHMEQWRKAAVEQCMQSAQPSQAASPAPVGSNFGSATSGSGSGSGQGGVPSGRR